MNLVCCYMLTKWSKRRTQWFCPPEADPQEICFVSGIGSTAQTRGIRTREKKQRMVLETW